MRRKYKIGMRTVKTALAVMIGLYTSLILNLNSPIFTSIAAITTMQPTFTESFKNVKNRLFTALIGVVLGYLFSLITNNPYLAPLVAGFGIIMIIWFLQLFNLKSLVTLTTVIFMASFSAQSDKIEYGFNRLIGTFIGVLIGVVVNYLISSPNIHQNFYDSIAKTYGDLLKITHGTLLTSGEKNMKKLTKDIESATTYYNLLKDETTVPFYSNIETKTPAILINLVNEVFLRYRVLEELNATHLKLNYKNIKLIERLFKYTIVLNETKEDDKTIVYNYHINTILRNMLEINEILESNIAVNSDEIQY